MLQIQLSNMYWEFYSRKYVLWNMYYEICTIKYLSNIIFPFHLRGETRPRMKMPGVARCWPLARALRNDVGAEHVQRMIRGLWLLGPEMILMWHIGFPFFDGVCNLRFEDEMDLQTSQFGTAFSKTLQGFHSRKPIQFSSMIFPRLNVDPWCGKPFRESPWENDQRGGDQYKRTWGHWASFKSVKPWRIREWNSRGLRCRSPKIALKNHGKTSWDFPKQKPSTIHWLRDILSLTSWWTEVVFFCTFLWVTICYYTIKWRDIPC